MTLNVVIANDGELEHETVVHQSAANLSAIKAALVKPGEYSNYLSPEPQSHRQGMEPPKWECWEAVEKSEMGGLISKEVWAQYPCPKGKVVLGTKRLNSRKVGERGGVVKPKCRFVAQDFRHIKGLHYEASSSPTPAAASICMALETAAVMDIELRHIDFEQAYRSVGQGRHQDLHRTAREVPRVPGRGGKTQQGYLRLGEGGEMLEHETDQRSEDDRIRAIACRHLCVLHVCCWEDGGDPRGTHGRSSSPDRHESSDEDFRWSTTLDVEDQRSG